MSVTMPVPAARLDNIKTLWRELQQTRPTSTRYQELVALIRAETFLHLTPTVVNYKPQPKA